MVNPPQTPILSIKTILGGIEQSFDANATIKLKANAPIIFIASVLSGNIPSVFKNYGFEMIFTAGFVILFNLIMLASSIKEGRYWKQVAEHENLL